MEEEDEHDVYVSQLREVFDVCDLSGSGFLDRQELEDLCNKLQLQDQCQVLVHQLLGNDPNARVGFEEFKEGFVAVLSETVDGLESSEDDLDEHGSTPPKHQHGDKKYGRRSRPETDTEDGLTDQSEADLISPRSNHLRSHSRMSSEGITEDFTEDDAPSRPEDVPPIDTSTQDEDQADTFEAEGQMNQNLADMELSGVTEEEHLREIWRELGVGTEGSLTLTELAIVCQHIGMEEMNQEELEHLFDKLDTDSDGQVSFNEFLHGLFAHGSSATVTPSTPLRPQSTPRSHKLRLSVVNVEDPQHRQTPSFLSMGSGMFSVLDVDGTGYSMPDSIIELWESLGVPQGADILEYLQFDLSIKVSLADLSYSLEQEMRSVEDDNATYQAALVSVECELKQQRSNTDHLTAERDKLKSDLNEANSRISLLVKEGDERTATLEKAREKDLLAVEKSYKEQLRSLQAELDQEREGVLSQSARQKARLEDQVTKLKEEEAKLKDRLTQSQKEIERLEHEILDMVDKNSELQRGIIRKEKEMEQIPVLQKKLEDIEKNREEIIDEYQKFSEEKIKQYVDNNKELKDAYDELTMEVEDLRHKRHRKRGGGRHGSDGNRTAGSLLEESLMDNNTPDDSEDDHSTSTTDSVRLRRRQLPRPPSTDAAPPTTPGVSEAKVAELTRCFSMERKDIEDAFKLEIAQLEDRQIREKNDLLKGFKREKEELAQDLSHQQMECVEAERIRLTDLFDQEKKDLIIRHESEKNLIEHKFAEEKANMLLRMREEQDEELEHRLAEQREHFTAEMEKTAGSSDNAKELKQQIAEMELQIKLQREELEMKHAKDRQTLEEHFEDEKAEQDAKHRLKVMEYDRMFSQGPENLKGQMKADFERLLEEATSRAMDTEKQFLYEQLDTQREAMQRDLAHEREALETGIRSDLEASLRSDREELESSLERERERIETEMDAERRRRDDTWQRQKEQLLTEIQQERDAMTSKYKTERKEMEKRYKEKISALQDSLEQEKQLLDVERDRFKAQYKREKERFDREAREMRDSMEEEINQQLQGKLEEEFVSQLERLRAAFDEERRELQARVTMYQEEVEEMTRAQSTDDDLRQRSDAAHRKQVALLQDTLRELKEEHANCGSEHKRLQNRIQQLNVEKEESIHAVRVEKTMAAPRPSSSPDSNKMILAAIESQRRLFLDQTSGLRKDIQGLDMGDPRNVTLLQLDHEKVVEEKRNLELSLKNTEEKMRELLEQSQEAEICKAKLENWEQEKASLEQQLDQTCQKLAEAQTALALANSSQVRHQQELREKTANMIDLQKYNALHARLADTERKAAEYEAALGQRASETSKLIRNSHDDHEREAARLQVEKEGIQDRLDITRRLLEEQVEKLKNQLHKSAKTDILVKDLYVENAHLVKCLQVTEKREKEAEKRVYKLEDKCKALTRVVHKMAPAALGY